MRRTLAVLAVALLAALAVSVSSPAATATTCTDTLAPGTYGAVTVPAGATCLIFDGPITIRGGISVGEGATFVLGSEETPDVTATISGGVRSTNAMSVQIHFATINGSVDLEGGAGPFGGPFDVTWNTFEDNRIMREAGLRNETSAPVAAWTLAGEGKMALDESKPLNAQNPTALKVELKEKTSLVNAGFKGAGLNIRKDATYLLSLFARAEGFGGPLAARLVGADGEVLAEAQAEGLGADWKKFDLELTAKATDATARLVLTARGQGTLCLDMVSLFPKATWQGRKNGLRPDLMKLVAGMHPAFVRFPGGCFVEGDKMAQAARWKQTIGPVEARPGHWNLWGYVSNDGLGFHEYLQMCEDLRAEPLFVINIGMAHKDAVPMEQIGEMVQDALDAIEYANGPVDSKWGAQRAAAGHPAPFGLKYMEIGNENGGPKYLERYPLFVKAIKAKYPEMHLICNVWNGNDSLYRTADMIDEHDYNTPEHFMKISNKYDSYDRQGPKVYMGEYAVTRGGCGQGNLIAALGEAAYMTGMERNADIVVMSSYAPLFVNPDWRRWNPNAIVFNQFQSYGTPSYWAQAMFGGNRADVNLPFEVSASATAVQPLTGRIGVGTWDTQAEFKNIVVTRDGQELFKSDFAGNAQPPRGRNVTGQWRVADGAIRQTGNDQPACVYFGQPDWADYTLTLKARKTGGAEGFLISFASQRESDKSWWNIGGWGNQRSGIELGGQSQDEKRCRVETGRWYDVKVELKGARVKCWLDGKLMHDVSRAPVRSMYGVAGLKGQDVILKVVNVAAQPQETQIDLAGAGKLEPTAQALVMTSESEQDENSFDQPEKVAPKAAAVSGVESNFKFTFPARSVTVLTLKQAK
jgi:alpha-L-arabinofuranosidase